eukprot:7781403-Pyramimonas_sp.AAC.1
MIFHVVAIPPRRLSRERCLPHGPSSSRVKEVLGDWDGPLGWRRAPREERKRRRKSTKHMPAELVIQWLSATRFLKTYRDEMEAARAFGKILSRGGPDDCAAMMARLQKPRPETLRLARVHLDVCAMLIMRMVFESLDWSKVDIYLYADSSPQSRGWDMMAATFA